ASAIVYIGVAFRITPKKTKAIKWITLSSLAFIGIFSALTGYFFSTSLSFIAGIIMFVIALAFNKSEPDKISF
ncbi:MAG TPA: hypothetical protein PLK94_01030, partial [Alphaproteobacteria bacterium]|nr:hypothetical protein [Alphaproteobacteria bacterium]